MPDPSTSRLGLYKSKSDGSELVNYSQDIGQNLDKLDAAVGFQACTSTTRPSTPYAGKPITETDTSYRTYFSNGTSPASGSWVEIPNSSGTFGGNLVLSTSSTLSIGAATLNRTSGGSLSANTNYQAQRSAATDVAYSALLTGDTFDRARIYADGKLELGSGSAARDTNLYRSGTNTLATDDSLSVALNLTVTGNLTVSGIGQERYVVKPSDTARTSTTTVADDPHLTATVVAGGVYIVRFVIFATTADSTSTDLKTGWNVPAGSTGLKMMHGPGDTAADFSTSNNTKGRFSGRQYATTGNYQAETNAIAVLEESIITIGGAAGSVTFQWSQSASSASAVTVLASSYLHIRRLA